MELGIKIDAESINKYVADAIMESSIGISLKKLIDDTIKDKINTSWDNPFKQIIIKKIEQLAEEFIRNPEHSYIINQSIAKLVTPNIIEKIISNGMRELRLVESDFDD